MVQKRDFQSGDLLSRTRCKPARKSLTLRLADLIIAISHPFLLVLRPKKYRQLREDLDALKALRPGDTATDLLVAGTLCGAFLDLDKNQEMVARIRAVAEEHHALENIRVQSGGDDSIAVAGFGLPGSCKTRATWRPRRGCTERCSMTDCRLLGPLSACCIWVSVMS